MTEILLKDVKSQVQQVLCISHFEITLKPSQKKYISLKSDKNPVRNKI